MTLDELIAQATALRERHGGALPVVLLPPATGARYFRHLAGCDVQQARTCHGGYMPAAWFDGQRGLPDAQPVLVLHPSP